MPERKAYHQGRERSDYEPDQTPERVGCREPHDAGAEYQPDPGIDDENEIAVEPSVADWRKRANAIVVGEVHERVRKPAKIRDKENPNRPERAPKWIVSQTKSAIQKHQRERQGSSQQCESDQPMSESAMKLQITNRPVFNAAPDVYVRKIRRDYQRGCGEWCCAFESCFCD